MERRHSERWLCAALALLLCGAARAEERAAEKLRSALGSDRLLKLAKYAAENRAMRSGPVIQPGPSPLRSLLQVPGDLRVPLCKRSRDSGADTCLVNPIVFADQKGRGSRGSDPQLNNHIKAFLSCGTLDETRCKEDSRCGWDSKAGACGGAQLLGPTLAQCIGEAAVLAIPDILQTECTKFTTTKDCNAQSSCSWAGTDEIAAFNELLKMFNASGDSNATDLFDLTRITELAAQAGPAGEEAAQSIVSVVGGILGGGDSSGDVVEQQGEEDGGGGDGIGGLIAAAASTGNVEVDGETAAALGGALAGQLADGAVLESAAGQLGSAAGQLEGAAGQLEDPTALLENATALLENATSALGDPGALLEAASSGGLPLPDALGALGAGDLSAAGLSGLDLAILQDGNLAFFEEIATLAASGASEICFLDPAKALVGVDRWSLLTQEQDEIMLAESVQAGFTEALTPLIGDPNVQGIAETTLCESIPNKALCTEKRGCVWRGARAEGNETEEAECEPDLLFVARGLVDTAMRDAPPICDVHRAYLEATITCMGHNDSQSCGADRHCEWDGSGQYRNEIAMLQGVPCVPHKASVAVAAAFAGASDANRNSALAPVQDCKGKSAKDCEAANYRDPPKKLVVVEARTKFRNIRLADLTSNSTAKKEFEDRFKIATARAAGVDPEFVVILELRSGSVEVHYKVVFPDFASEAADDFEATASTQASTIFAEDPVLSTLGADDVGTVEVATDVSAEDAFSDQPIESGDRSTTTATSLLTLSVAALVALFGFVG